LTEEAKGDDAPETTADSLTEREVLVRDVEDALHRNEDGSPALLALCERIPDGEIILSESDKAGKSQVDRLQSKLRQWVDAQHEERTVGYNRRRGANDVNTLVALLESMRGDDDEKTIRYVDIREEISNTLVTLSSLNPRSVMDLLDTTDWRTLQDYYGDGASLVVAAAYAPFELTATLYRDIGALGEPEVDEIARRSACGTCTHCVACQAKFGKTTVQVSPATAKVQWKRQQGAPSFKDTYTCTQPNRLRLPDKKISIKKCNDICHSVARLCHRYNRDVANALDDKQLRAYAEAAVELNHNNHGGLGAISSRDVTKAVAASLRARRRTNWSGSRQSAMRDNDPRVRAARAGPLHRFATRPGGAGQYTED